MNISLDILFLFVYLLFLYNGFSSISATIYVTATLGQHALGIKNIFLNNKLSSCKLLGPVGWRQYCAVLTLLG